jgi:hypothetical protein
MMIYSVAVNHHHHHHHPLSLTLARLLLADEDERLMQVINSFSEGGCSQGAYLSPFCRLITD